MISSRKLCSLVLLVSQTFLYSVFALPGVFPSLTKYESKRAYNATRILKPSQLPNNSTLRPPLIIPKSTNTASVTTTSSAANTSSSAVSPTAPFGIITTVISGTTFSLTYVATTASKPTIIVESNAQTTTTTTFLAGAPIWLIPILPPGFPSTTPPPPLHFPPPSLEDGTGCEFGCEIISNLPDSQKPTITQDPSSQTIKSSSASTTSSSSTSSTSTRLVCEVNCLICNDWRHEATPGAISDKPRRESKKLWQHSRASLEERNILGEDSEIVVETYDDARKAQNTLIVQLADGPTNGNIFIRQGISSWQFTPFDEAEHNIYVEGLAGCTSVIVVSRLGAWASHIWEGPSFTSGDARFQTDVIDFLQHRLGEHTKTFTDGVGTITIIMSPAPESHDLHGFGDASKGDHEQKYPGRIGQITTALNQILPGAQIRTFIYQVQRDSNRLRTAAYGKAMILYSNDQRVDPDPQGSFPDWVPSRHAYQVWTQEKLIAHDSWFPCQVQSKRNAECPVGGSPSLPLDSRLGGPDPPILEPTKTFLSIVPITTCLYPGSQQEDC